MKTVIIYYNSGHVEKFEGVINLTLKPLTILATCFSKEPYEYKRDASYKKIEVTDVG